VVKVVILRRPTSFSHSLLRVLERPLDFVCIVHLIIDPIDGLLSIRIGLAWVDSSSEEDLHNFEVAILNSIEQGGVFIVVDTVQIASGIHKQFDNVVITIKSRYLQWCIAGVVRNVDVTGSVFQSRLGYVIFTLCAGSG
jgi:hypothetical protein